MEKLINDIIQNYGDIVNPDGTWRTVEVTSVEKELLEYAVIHQALDAAIADRVQDIPTSMRSSGCSDAESLLHFLRGEYPVECEISFVPTNEDVVRYLHLLQTENYPAPETYDSITSKHTVWLTRDVIEELEKLCSGTYRNAVTFSELVNAAGINGGEHNAF